MAKKKKQSMMKDAIILCMISLIAALALGFVNEVTKDRIAFLAAQAKAEAYREVYPEAVGIVDVENNEILATTLEDAADILAAGGFSNTTIDEVCLVQDADMNHVGYVASVTTKGYNMLTLTFGYTTDGTCTGLAFLSIEETPGFGLKANEPEFKNQFAGNKGDYFGYEGNEAGMAKINAITGATETTKGVVKGVNAGICFIEELQTRLGGAN